MDIYSYLFKSIEKKTKIEYKKSTFEIKFYKDQDLIYEICDVCRIVINIKDYSAQTTIFKREYEEHEFKKILEIINIINKYNYVNYNTLDDNLVFHGVDYITVNTLSGFENPYLNYNYKVQQKNFPKSESLDILKSNAYYYDKFFKENIKVIINLHLKKFIGFLKKIYGQEFKEKKYLKDVMELEKFDYTLKNFILERANLDKKRCFNFFYDIMGRILDDLYLLPKKYIYFY